MWPFAPVLLLAAGLWSACVAEAADLPADLFVSPQGSDENPGTAEAPLRTIPQAAQAAGPGTIVHVAPGVYEGGFITRADGVRYLSAVMWGAKIVPPADSPNKFGWDNRGADVRIDGFEVDGSAYRGGVPWRWGLYTAGSNSIIANAKVHGIALDPAAATDDSGGAGIGGDGYYGATNITVTRNFVYDIGPAGVTSNLVHGIYVTTTGAVTDNEVHGIVGTAIHLWHDARRVVVAGNRVSGAKFGILVGGGDYVTTSGPNDHTEVYDNIVHGNRACGIAEQGDTGRHNRYAGNRVSGNSRDWCLQNGLADLGPGAMPPRRWEGIHPAGIR